MSSDALAPIDHYQDSSAYHAAWGAMVQQCTIAFNSLLVIQQQNPQYRVAAADTFVTSCGCLVAVEQMMRSKGAEPCIDILLEPMRTIRQAAIKCYSSNGTIEDANAFWDSILPQEKDAE